MTTGNQHNCGKTEIWAGRERLTAFGHYATDNDLREFFYGRGQIVKRITYSKTIPVTRTVYLDSGTVYTAKEV